MAAVENRIVPAQSIPTVDIAKAVDKPEVGLPFFVLDHHICPKGTPRLHQKVRLEGIWLVDIRDVVREQLVSVEIAQLREVLDVAFCIDIEALRQIEFKAGHKVVGGLEAVHHFPLLSIGQLEVILKVLGARQEAIEQVDNVPV